jgi:hypothetical protein
LPSIGIETDTLIGGAHAPPPTPPISSFYHRLGFEDEETGTAVVTTVISVLIFCCCCMPFIACLRTRERKRRYEERMAASGGKWTPPTSIGAPTGAALADPRTPRRKRSGAMRGASLRDMMQKRQSSMYDAVVLADDEVVEVEEMSARAPSMRMPPVRVFGECVAMPWGKGSVPAAPDYPPEDEEILQVERRLVDTNAVEVVASVGGGGSHASLGSQGSQLRV